MSKFVPDLFTPDERLVVAEALELLKASKLRAMRAERVGSVVYNYRQEEADTIEAIRVRVLKAGGE